MRTPFLATLLAITVSVNAQLPMAYQKKSKSRALGEQARTATLYVMIENEKGESDATLVEAIKSNWHAGPVKYMSALEFIDKFKHNSFDSKNLYLFHNHLKSGALPAIIHSVYNGFYLCNDPVALFYSTKPRKTPPYLHFSSNALVDYNGNINRGYYMLMIRNFDHDIRFCQDENNFTKKSAYKKRNGIKYFVPADTIAGKTTLLVKEQVKRSEKKVPKKKNKRPEKPQPMVYVTDNYLNKKKPMVVFPEDVEHAVKIKDPQILLYSGGCLYSAETGETLATSRYKPSRTAGNILTAVSTLASVVVVVFLFKN